jgi:hypothetical protein
MLSNAFTGQRLPDNHLLRLYVLLKFRMLRSAEEAFIFDKAICPPG